MPGQCAKISISPVQRRHHEITKNNNFDDLRSCKFKLGVQGNPAFDENCAEKSRIYKAIKISYDKLTETVRSAWCGNSLKKKIKSKHRKYSTIHSDFG